MPWDDLLTVCDEMEAGGEGSRLLPNGYEICAWPGDCCYTCGRTGGLFTARDPALPNPDDSRMRGDEPSVAQYCTICRHVGAGWHYRYSDWDYLPILRRRLLAVGAERLPLSGGKCPECGEATRSFGDSWNDNECSYWTSWTVCPNAGCSWKGQVGGGGGPSFY